MIDHHLNPSDFCQFRISETSACSTAQLLYEWMDEAGILSELDATIGSVHLSGNHDRYGIVSFSVGESAYTSHFGAFDGNRSGAL